MADIAVTAANVVLVSGSTSYGVAGATITAGQALYLDSATQTLKPAQSDSAAHAAFAGIALDGASSGQPIAYQTSGTITIGGTSVTGQPYVVSATAGGIRPVDDVAGGEYITMLGVGTSATVVQIIQPGFGGASGVIKSGAIT